MPPPGMPLALALSEDEAFVFTVSLMTTAVTWFLAARTLGSGPRLGSPSAPRRVVWASALTCPVVLFVVLRRWASWDVRDSVPYLTQYLLLGTAWVGLGRIGFSWLGLSLRDDVVERGNLAAAVAGGGAALGLTLAYAGGNVGDGPGWGVVVLASGLASAAWFGLWTGLELLGRPSEAIGIDRDLAAGLRHAAFCVGTGAILGRAAAGDWVSGAETLKDLLWNGQGALGLLVLGVLFERALRPTAEAPRRSVVFAGILPALVQLALAGAWIATRGSWE